MNDPQNREETIFEAALQLPPEQRTAHLQQACGDDASLRQRVELLLKSHEQASRDFLEKPPALGPNKTVVVSAPPPTEELLGTMIGRYKLLEKVGEGGFGIVYVAEQREPVKRRVALKIIKLGMDTRQVVARFEVERQALALMDHPNIAKVFDAGATETGRPYFVMELVRGIRITDYCDQNNLCTRERLELFAKVCQAIQHAHQKGIIHRDIKPSNILVTLHDGVPVPKVIDFGIAKATQGELTEKTVYTQLQQFIGTPAYMSPEQAEMSGLDIDTRSDIYALGVLLYELLTGRTPFDQKELLDAGLDGMRRMIREQEPQRPSTRVSSLQGEDRTVTAKRHGLDAPKLVHLLQGDLDWIVMKCLEKDRTRRYETANGVAMDLQRHLNNEPVVARPPSTVYRLQKFARRNKLAFAAGTAVALALCLGVIASTWQAVRATREQRIADRERARAQSEAARADENAASEARQRREADEATHRTKQALSASLEVEADRLAREGNSAKALAHLARALRIDPANRVAAQRIVSLLNQRDFPLPMPGRPAGLAFDPVRVLAYSANLGRFCVLTNQTSVAVLDGKDGHLIGQSLPLGDRLIASRVGYDGSRYQVGATNSEIRLAFDAHGSRLAISRADKTTVWDCDSGLEIAELDGLLNSFSPDGKFAVVGKRVVAVESGQDLFVITAPRASDARATFSSDSRMLAAVTGDDENVGNYQAEVFFTTNGAPVISPIELRVIGSTPFLRFTPDGRRIVNCGSSGAVEVWDLFPRRQSLPTLRHGSSVWVMQSTADGRLLAAGGRNGRGHLWNLANGQPAREPCQSSEGIRMMCLSPNGDWLTTWSAATFSSKLRNEKWWDIRVGRAVPIRMFHPAGVSQAAYSADGSLVQTVCLDGAARIWRAEDGTLLFPSITHGGGVIRAVLSRNAKLLATGSVDGEVRLWDAQSGQPLKRFGTHDNRISALVFTPDGRQLASGATDGTVKFWDVESGKLAGEGPAGQELVYDFSVDRSGSRLAANYRSYGTQLFEVPSLKRIASLTKNQGWTYHTSFSSDGKWLATSSGGDAAQLWNAVTGEGPLMRYPHESGVFMTHFSSDGRLLVTASYDGTARVWERETGKPVTEPLPQQGVRWAFFGPGDLTVITASQTFGNQSDGFAMVWDVRTGRAVSERYLHDGSVNFANFSPDGRHILTAGKDGVAAIHDWIQISGEAPDWLPELAEAIGSYRLTESGVTEYLTNAPQIVARLRHTLANATPSDAAGSWAKWYLSDRGARTISPFSAMSVRDYAEKLAQQTGLPALEEALELGSRNPMVYQKLASLVRSAQPETAQLYRRLAEESGGVPVAETVAAVSATAPDPLPADSEIDELDPLNVEALLRHEGRFVRVKGKITRYSTSPSGNHQFLDFARDYRAGLTLEFARNPLEFKPETLKSFVNDTVVVTAKVTTYGGKPQFAIKSLAEIRIVEESVAPPATEGTVVGKGASIGDTNAVQYLDPAEGESLMKRVGQVVTIKGRIVKLSSATTAKVYYLNFSENFRASMSLVFFPAQNPSEFRPELLQNYVNKTVVAEGEITNYRDRPQMQITSLSQLKIVDDAEGPARKP